MLVNFYRGSDRMHRLGETSATVLDQTTVRTCWFARAHCDGGEAVAVMIETPRMMVETADEYRFGDVVAVRSATGFDVIVDGETLATRATAEEAATIAHRIAQERKAIGMGKSGFYVAVGEGR